MKFWEINNVTFVGDHAYVGYSGWFGLGKIEVYERGPYSIYCTSDGFVCGYDWTNVRTGKEASEDLAIEISADYDTWYAGWGEYSYGATVDDINVSHSELDGGSYYLQIEEGAM